MHIDARNLELHDLLTEFKDALSSNRGCAVDIEVLASTENHAKKVAAFASMSGCSTKIDKKNNYYIIHVKGNVCCT